ncbi:MAG TPA: Ig domain-containing protein [Verrucomicrobiae bacterium]|nr:Ig domain-containing protein [Verrucomicrobiae bacterium]
MKRTASIRHLLRTYFRSDVIALLLAGLTCNGIAATTSLRLNSEPGDPLLGGQQLFFTDANGSFGAYQSFSNSVSISFYGSGHNFSLDFAAPVNQPLVAGSYLQAERLAFRSPGKPGMWISGDGVGCNTITGSFEVKQVAYGAGNQINKFWATFEQHCENAADPLKGEIRFNADVPVVLSAPASLAVAEGGLLTFTVRATEVQNRRVTLAASNLPSGASFVDNGSNTGTFSWTPGVGNSGTYDVIFRGDNGLGAVDEATTRIRVTIPGDEIATALRITTLPYTNRTETSAATINSEDPYTCTYPSHTIWYTFSATNRLRIRATTRGSDYETVVSVFSGPITSLSSITCDQSFGSTPAEVIFDTVAGQNYYFMVGAYDDDLGGNLVFTVDTLVSPSNDDIPNAITIPALPYTHTIQTAGAIMANDDPYPCDYEGHSVWYAFTPNAPMRIEASTEGSDYVAGLGVFSGARGSLTRVACGVDTGSFTRVAFNAVAGRRYYFMITGAGGRLVFTVNRVLPPANDDFDRATMLTSLPFIEAINTSLATTNRDDPMTCNQPGATVWYSFTPGGDLFIEAHAEASDYSVVLSVWTGARNALQEVACFGGDYVRFPASAGTTYFIMAGSRFREEGGHLVLVVNGRPKLKIGVTVDSEAGADSKIGAATIQGTVTCSEPVMINLTGLLRQTVGRFHVIAGTFGAPYYFPDGPEPLLVRCNGQTAWSARVFSDDGSFGGGHAFVSASAIASVDNDTATADTEGTIHLSGSTKVKLDVDQAQLLALGESESGTVLVQSISVMGRTNVLEASTNLRDWSPIATNVPLSNPFDWVDRDKRTHPQRFYRVLTLP